MNKLILLLAAALSVGACTSLREPYDDDDLSARARPTPNAAAFMGYHGPIDRTSSVSEQ